ncbi:MAG: 30S ribosomal protein S17 [Patescibacteria group bacterium]|jgi:small subunit ribosomal protein S17|nr:30S ribosomal protein S17 [Patescibacteria group bacterium]
MSNQEIKKVNQRKLQGVVSSAKGNKTIVVDVVRTKLHPKYLKRFTVTKKYHVHDEKNEFQVGDKVTFVACRPLSKTKTWRAVSKNS